MMKNYKHRLGVSITDVSDVCPSSECGEGKGDGILNGKREGRVKDMLFLRKLCTLCNGL